MVGEMVLRAFVMVLVAAAITLSSVPARADAAEVEKLITKGNDLRREGKPGAALPYFQQAYELTRTPRTAGQLGLAELSAGYPAEAFDHLTSALDAPNDPWTQRYRGMLSEALTKARARVGELVVAGRPSGAEVIVNGHTVGTLPLPSTIKLAASNAEVLVRAPGHIERREHVKIAIGRKEELTFNLEPVPKPVEPAKPVVVPLPPQPPRPDSPIVPPQPVTPVDPDEGPPTNRLRTYAWIAGGSALAAAGTGLVLHLVARSTISEFGVDCTHSSAGVDTKDPSAVSSAQCSARYQDWENQRLWSIVGYATGAALAVTSGVLFWMSRPADSTKEAHAFITCAPTPNGVLCRSTF